MGLLDWKDTEEDVFPDFQLGLSHTQSAPLGPSESSNTSLSTTSSNASTESSNPAADRPDLVSPKLAPSISRPLSIQISSEDSSKPRSKAAPQKRSRPSARRTTTAPNSTSLRPSMTKRSPSFDLFGNDLELQRAESRIGFCEICLKHCDIQH